MTFLVRVWFSEFGSLFFLTSTSLIKKGSDWINRFSVKTQPYLSIYSPLTGAGCHRDECWLLLHLDLDTSISYSNNT